jgi:hypothetical protein
MNRIRLTMLLTVIVLFAWAGVASAEDPPPEHSVLQVTGWYTEWQTVHVSVENPSQTWQTGSLVVWFIYHGEMVGFAHVTTVPPESTVDVEITFPFHPVFASVNIYEYSPGGVYEDPDPIADVKEINPDE